MQITFTRILWFLAILLVLLGIQDRGPLVVVREETTTNKADMEREPELMTTTTPPQIEIPNKTPLPKPIFSSKKTLIKTVATATPSQETPLKQTILVKKNLLAPADLNLRTRAALVNILCTTKTGGSLKPITGSGSIIDPRGVIITNAHVAQYFLLEDYLVKDFISCTIRTGSPASPAYKAKLLYLPPAWIEKNAAKIKEQSPLGSGQHDYALLYITGSANPDGTITYPLPYLEPDVAFDQAELDHPVLLAAYPAELSGSILAQTSLSTVSSLGIIKEAFYFSTTTVSKIDLFSLGGTILAQSGSSGGAVVSQEDGKQIGIIVTSTDAKTTAEKNLRAITLSHVNRSFEQNQGQNLLDFLKGDPESLLKQFEEKDFPRLKEILIDQINR